MALPTDRDARNALPIWDGLMMYFPDVWAEVAKVSVLGNKQHNLGAKLFWNREVSTDHLNKVMRHCLDHGTGTVLDTDGTFHMAKAVWRACAELQLAIETQRKKELEWVDAAQKPYQPYAQKPYQPYAQKPYQPYELNKE